MAPVTEAVSSTRLHWQTHILGQLKQNCPKRLFFSVSSSKREGEKSGKRIVCGNSLKGASRSDDLMALQCKFIRLLSLEDYLSLDETIFKYRQWPGNRTGFQLETFQKILRRPTLWMLKMRLHLKCVRLAKIL